MSQETFTATPNRRRRSALLASALALGATSYFAIGAIIGDGQVALADQVRVEAVANTENEQTVQAEPASRAWLGVQIQPVTRDIADSLGIASTDGALVADPQQGGPAAAAGIKAGDVILKVNGTAVKGPRELSRMIAAVEPEQTVKVTLLREGNEQDVDVKLGKLERQTAAAEPGAQPETPKAEPASVDALGLALEENADGEGLVVRSVESDSAASENGIETGDVIVSVGGKTVDSVESVQAEVENAKERGRKAVLMQVQGQNGGTRFVALPLDRA